MRQLLAFLTAVALLVAVADSVPAAPPAASVTDQAPPNQAPAQAPRPKRERIVPPQDDQVPNPAATLSPVSPLPSRAPLYQLPAPVLREGPIGAVPNPGPVTGYGPGGMARPPGAPANPPYR